jgi:hypothetical protein
MTSRQIEVQILAFDMIVLCCDKWCWPCLRDSDKYIPLLIYLLDAKERIHEVVQIDKLSDRRVCNNENRTPSLPPTHVKYIGKNVETHTVQI